MRPRVAAAHAYEQPSTLDCPASFHCLPKRRMGKSSILAIKEAWLEEILLVLQLGEGSKRALTRSLVPEGIGYGTVGCCALPRACICNLTSQSI